MDAMPSAGARLRAALNQECPLQVAGVINAYAARLAEAAGFRALYISGGGVAASSCGIPDVGLTTMDDVLTAICIIVATTSPIWRRRRRSRKSPTC
jgi:methylisocitrate lyase